LSGRPLPAGRAALATAAFGGVLGSTLPIAAVLMQTEVAGGLSVDAGDAAWSVTLYNVGQIIGLPLALYGAAVFGCGRAMQAAGLGFGVASLAAASALGLGPHLVSRVLQGVFGGGLPTLMMVLVMTRLTGPARAAGLSLFGASTTAGAGFAAAVAAACLVFGDWRALFWVQGLGGLAYAGLARACVQDAPAAPHRLRDQDWEGYLFLTLGLGLLAVGLSEGERRYWFETWWITGALACGTVGVALAVWRLATAERPLVRLALLRRPAFLGGVTLQALSRVSLLFTLVAAPQILARASGLRLEQTALLLAPMSLTILAGAAVAHHLCARGDARIPLGLGLAIMALGAAAAAGAAAVGGADHLATPLWASGFGQGLFSVAVMRFATAGLVREDGPTCGLLFNLARLFGLIGGLALLTRGLTEGQAALVTRLGETAQVGEAAVRIGDGLAGMGATAAAVARAKVAGDVVSRAAGLAQSDQAMLIALILGLGAALVLLLPGLRLHHD
jgi:MFS transporter, DHA2 family, multidrug resistance protein